jgi:5-formyltetrahydrofolate cyclo-ligase
MKPLTKGQAAFWKQWLATLPAHKRPRRAFVEAGYAGDARGTDALIRLYLDGRKTAGSSLVKDFEAAGDSQPKPGNYWIVLDGRGRPRLINRTKKILVFVFKNVPARIARAEGEGDRSIAHWKRVHRRAYAPFLRRWGISDLDTAEVVTEFFDVVFKPERRRRRASPTGRRTI